MTFEDIAALCLFSFVGTITPGPNNLMLLANSANFGLRRSLPQMLGIPSGQAVMLLLLGVGLEELYDAVPWFHWVLKALGSAFLLWLAAKIAFTEHDIERPEAHGRPFRFHEAFTFQVVNPKSWTMVVAALAFLSESDNWYDVFIIAAIFCCFSLASSVVWAAAGSAISRILTDTRSKRRINFVLGGMLALLVIPLLLV